MQAKVAIRGPGSGPRIHPPHVAIGHIRTVAGLTLDQVIDRIEEETGRRYTRGAISAVENGHRGASAGLLEALEIVYGLPTGAISTDYHPRQAPRRIGRKSESPQRDARQSRQEHPGAAPTPTTQEEVGHVPA